MTNGGLQDRRNEAEVKESRIKIKNAIRIIDERLVLYYQLKKSNLNEHQMKIIDNQIQPLQKIRDELRPKEKSI